MLLKECANPMKTVAIVRQVDDLGRVVIPMEIRRRFELENDTLIEISVEDNKIILGKYNHKCVFCGSEKGITEFKKQYICDKCKDEFINR